MVWLDVTGNDGNALYFVTDRIERRLSAAGGGFTVSGLLGDGCYEGEVLVEVGETSAVTFVDDWLARADFSRFAARIDRARVGVALAELAKGLAAELTGGERSRRGRRMERSGRVQEPVPTWRAVA
ncbi:MAG: hypothetical protein RBT64_12960 [Trichloromonas sp.]|jgi:hypothetical protein|nr:hypothetical protein [Trichloromonas sp.]